ncbi:hypothetical protein [Roseicyclus sp.]|uniref:hypothetical protein n=1 Tax=Roseicyclus sp. TaxID=1914329 RepID=UPI001BCC2258|nr:hypothetical protein [Roseicyclus sp.]
MLGRNPRQKRDRSTAWVTLTDFIAPDDSVTGPLVLEDSAAYETPAMEGMIVEIVAPGSLPNDGKVIDDQRKYE